MRPKSVKNLYVKKPQHTDSLETISQPRNHMSVQHKRKIPENHEKIPIVAVQDQESPHHTLEHHKNAYHNLLIDSALERIQPNFAVIDFAVIEILDRNWVAEGRNI